MLALTTDDENDIVYLRRTIEAILSNRSVFSKLYGRLSLREQMKAMWQWLENSYYYYYYYYYYVAMVGK